jgi:hypothetical protein
MDKPSQEEWANALSNSSNKSAAGNSGIGYLMIKKASSSTQDLIRNFIGLCYKKQMSPLQWKLTSLFPIPKPKDWDYCIANTRPIVLIECVRKLATKIINTRLSTTFTTHNVLRGPNYAGLKGDSTDIPIHTINNIIEDAREKKQELWIAFQDMAKAFDSVGLVSLEKALTRIKVPTEMTNFIIDLFQNRQIRIITSYGLSDVFTGKDGIDQGDTISPLLWRIFYDPLLSHIQHKLKLGYTITAEMPPSIAHTRMENDFTIATSAFANDTI